MILTEIDHVAIAVNDLDAAVAYYSEAFGAEVAHREVVDSDGVEEALIKVADSYIQLTAATRPDSPIAKFLERRGEGLHHVGYRVDDFAYLTDCSEIPERSWPLLEGLSVLVLDALRHRPHPTHLTLSQAVETAARIGAERTYFTHMCHDLPHAETCAALPPGVTLAHDGLVIDVQESAP